MDLTLEDRLSALEARLEIFDLEGRYCRYFDDHDGEAWSQLFVEDGIYRSRDPEGTFVRGRESLKNFCDDAPFDGLHLFHLPQITVVGDRATARIHLEYRGMWPRESGTPQVDMFGYYDVGYTRVERIWRIERRVTSTYSHRTTSTAGYRSGGGLDDPALAW